MNYVSLLGRLTRDPEVSYTQGGKAYTRFSLAVQRAGNREEADFINCVAWEKTAETIGQYFKKGSRILIQGRLSVGSYEKNGETRYTTDVVISNFEFIDARNSEGGSSSNFTRNEVRREPVQEDISMDDEDDFPF